MKGLFLFLEEQFDERGDWGPTLLSTRIPQESNQWLDQTWKTFKLLDGLQIFYGPRGRGLMLDLPTYLAN